MRLKSAASSVPSSRSISAFGIGVERRGEGAALDDHLACEPVDGLLDSDS
jgi:hypothetical protein